jgi:hypothetical protein
MKKFMLLYKGPATPPDASHAAWPAWFEKAGDRLVSIGSPMANGFVVRRAGFQDGSATSLNGYSIVQASDADAVRDLVKDHPYLAQGSDEFTVEIFELPG